MTTRALSVVARIREWWKHLGYSNGRRNGAFRTWGIRPWRGAPFFWFTIDSSGTAKQVQSDKHVGECEECREAGVPTPKRSKG